MKPTVRSLGVHLPGKKVILAACKPEALMKVDSPSPLERYLGRSADESFDHLTYADYYANYSVDSKASSDQSPRDICEPSHFANRRTKVILCMLNTVSPMNHELFALRLLLRTFAARSWEDLYTQNGQVWASFQEAAREAGLIRDRQDEAVISVRDAIAMNRPPSELRFMVAQMIAYGANRETLLDLFIGELSDSGDTREDTIRKVSECISGVRHVFVAMPGEEEFGAAFQPDVARDTLTPEQNLVARAIVDAVVQDGVQLMFLQGSAGTGKTFTVRAIIEMLRRGGKKCLVCATTGIAAVQYRGGTTLHSLFRLGTDDQDHGGFQCHIGRESIDARHILSADLIVVDEVSMLTPEVANRMSLTLKCISQVRSEFGGKRVLFVGDLLQLPPVVRNSSTPVIYRLITRMPWWHTMRKFRLERPMRCPDGNWARFLWSISRGEENDLPKWNGLRAFGIEVTNDVNRAMAFISFGLNPAQRFPLDRQWIAPVNRLASEINATLQDWRRDGGAPFLGMAVARSELPVPFPNCPGLSAAHQLDFIHRLESPDLPSSELKLFQGDPLLLFRNVNTPAGLAKGRRCNAVNMHGSAVQVEFDDGQAATFGRIPMEKRVHGVKFLRWQVPLKLVFSGTVHRSQGMTLARAVVDCRSKFWEHGQLYVALSRVRDPRDLCVLLPGDVTDLAIRPTVDNDVVQILDSIGQDEGGNLAMTLMGVEEADHVVSQEGALPDPEGMAYDGAEFEDLNHNRQSMPPEEVDPAECHDPLPVHECPDEDQDLIFTMVAHVSKMAATARQLINLQRLIMDPIRAIDDFKLSDMPSSLEWSRPEGELCHDAWQVFLISRALRAPVPTGRNSFSSMVRAFERFMPRPLPNARKLYHRLFRPMRRACIPLGDLFSCVYHVSMVELSHITASQRRCRDDRRQLLAYWVNKSMIRLTRFLAIYRFSRDFRGAQMGAKFGFSTPRRVHLDSL
jgi:hypothetical protein